jgi:CRISPR/Cas system CMR subunit Cmr4 (Cas7 group RAMP superfamily)
MYIPKYVARFQYEITKERVAEINTKYLNSIDYELDTFTQEVEHVDLEDYRFLVCVRERLFISIEEKGEDSIKISLIRPNEKARFEVVKEINSDNHPWIEEVIPVGTILKGSSAPDYGTVNWFEGVGLSMEDGISQVNREFIKLAINN